MMGLWDRLKVHALLSRQYSFLLLVWFVWLLYPFSLWAGGAIARRLRDAENGVEVTGERVYDSHAER